MRRSVFFGVCVSIAVIGVHPVQAGEKAKSSQRAKTFETTISRTVKLQYLLFLPEGYETSEKKTWPLILFLHGAGESGSNINLVKKHGPPKIVETKKDFPFIVVSPQSPKFGWDAEALIALLDDVSKTHRVDLDRVYVTGLSMGGFGTWELAGKYPDRFAAAVPICGGGNRLWSRNLKSIPIWVFHGAKDTAVALAESERMVQAVEKAGGTNIKMTVYPDAGHDSWTETYNNPQLYEWLLQQKRGQGK
jgi:predicted peptidase